jgi:hypothetical protein
LPERNARHGWQVHGEALALGTGRNLSVDALIQPGLANTRCPIVTFIHEHCF